MVNGLLHQIGSMILNLPGFYIAALAAIVAFDRKGFDVLLPEPTPKVRTLLQGAWVDVELTRRKMLTFLFAYLTALSIFITITISFVNSVAEPAAQSVAIAWRLPIRYVVAIFCLFTIWHLVSVTLFGLYQLSDRIFRD